MLNNAGIAWLSGPKYDFSRQQYGASWNIGINVVLGWYGKSALLDAARDIHDVVRIFRGHQFWKQDGCYQLYDTVFPPDYLMKNGGDDCDGWAMTHCQAINYALSRFGYSAWIITYLADPFWMSHHFCAVRDPHGKFWVIQPQPTQEQWQTYGEACQTVFGPYNTLEETPAAVAAQYSAKVVWWDKRDGWYRPAG